MRIRWLVVLALLLGAGCTTARRPPSVEAVIALPDASTLVRALEQQRAARTSLRSLARFQYEGPDGRGHAKQVVLVSRPERLRIEVFSPLGSMFVLAVTNSALAAFVRDEATLYRGRASRANLQRYARVNLEAADAVDLLLGVPPQRGTRNDVVSADLQSGTVKLWRQISDGTQSGAQVIWFDRELRVVATEHRDLEGDVVLRARFGDFAPEHLGLPTSITIELPGEQRRVELRLREVEVNPTLAPELFTLATPAGITEVWLDEESGASS